MSSYFFHNCYRGICNSHFDNGIRNGDISILKGASSRVYKCLLKAFHYCTEPKGLNNYPAIIHLIRFVTGLLGHHSGNCNGALPVLGTRY